MYRHVSDDPWRTGTVAWDFLNIVDRMLGFERTLTGFHLRPKLPSHWNEVSFVRPFRGVAFEIHLRRGPNPRIEVEGKAIEGDFIPVESESLTGTVRIYAELPMAAVNGEADADGRTGIVRKEKRETLDLAKA
jgi:cellobiose phosphorylase